MPEEREEQYKGMTVNERLFSANLLSAFDKALADQDLEEARRLLRLVDVDDISIASILKQSGHEA